MKELKNSKERGTAAVVIAKLRMREKEMREMLLARRQAVVRELRGELRRGLGRPAQRGLDLVEEGGLSVMTSRCRSWMPVAPCSPAPRLTWIPTRAS
jgi:hypothetical protein